MGGLIGNQPTQSGGRPKAALNWIFFDEQFKWVAGGFDMVNDAGTSTAGTFKNHIITGLPVTKNGYLYVWASNESKFNVFFDNLQLIHNRGPVLEETHYYPFGLTMQGISSRSASFGGAENKYKYSRKELQNKEFADGSGLEEYDFGSRFYNQQIGRWHNIDPLADEWESYSPYAFTLNNPIINIDPNGEDVYLFYAVKYDKEEDNRMFMQAAITRAFDLIESGEVGEGDIISMNFVSDLGELENSVESKTKELSPKYGKTREFGIWSHAGTDGPIGGVSTSRNALDDKQMTMDGWSQIDFNWADKGPTKAGFYGCNTGRDPEGSDRASFVTELSGKKNMKDVFVWGQSTSSYPSMYTDVRESTSAMRDGYFNHPTYMVAAPPLKKVADRIFGQYAPTTANPMRISRNGKGEIRNAVGQPYYQPGRKKGR
jgi:RHS repeat-associated protein